MKKLSVMFAALALLGAACGDSDTKKGMPNASGNEDGGGSAGGNNGVTIPDAGGGETLPFPACARENVPGYPPNDAPLVWTEADLKACSTACPKFDPPCVSTTCPNAEAFFDCFDDNLHACLYSEGGDCNTEWETYVCCTDANCLDVAGGDAEFDACIDTKCSGEVDKARTCFVRELESRSTIRNRCLMPSLDACLQPPMGDAGVSEDAGAGAMMTKSLTIDPSGLDAVLHKVRMRAPYTRGSR